MSQRITPTAFKKIAFLLLLTVSITILMSVQTTQAATVSDNVFLHGTYIAVGIAPNGCFGSTEVAPTGYHAAEDTGLLGIVSDYEEDGWRSGNPAQSGDFAISGADYESWGVQWVYAEEEHNYGYRRGSDSLIFSPAALIETSSGTTQSAKWATTIESESQGIYITQEFSFDEDDDYILVTVTIKNTGSVTLEDFSFMRGIDPDQEYDCCDNDATLNEVLYQPGKDNNTKWAVVGATGLVHEDMAIYLGTSDSRALVSANERSQTYDPDNVLDSQELGPVRMDTSIQLAYALGDFAPGETLEFTFFYGFSEKSVEKALEAIEEVEVLPDTGFAPGISTALTSQPETKSYAAYSDLWLEVPKLGLEMDILGVPAANGEWDVSWLGQNAGWLEGSAFPTLTGNTVLTGHVWSASGYPGPFINIKSLQYGDALKIHYNGLVYTYEVRESSLISNAQVDKALQHEEYDWLTLLTCEDWNLTSETYNYRRMVRAVLVSVDVG